MKPHNPPPPPRAENVPAAGTPPPLHSAALFGARDEVLIRHGEETYRLRRTRQGKLILTK